MRLLKTQDNLEALEELSSSRISWDEALAVMEDVLLDIRSESGRELNEMEFSADALQKWRTIANMLLSIPMVAEVEKLTERGKKRVTDFRRQLKDNAAAAAEAKKNLQAAEEEEERLQEQLAEQKAVLLRLKDSKQKAFELTESIQSLEQEIAALQSIDVDQLKNKQNDLHRELTEKRRLAEQLDEITEQLDKAASQRAAMQSETDKLKREIETVHNQIADLQKEGPDLRNTLEHKKLELEEKQKNQDAEIRELSQSIRTLEQQVNDTIDRIDRLNTEKEETKRKLEDYQPVESQLKDAILKTENEIKTLREQCIALQNKRKELLTQKNTLCDDIERYRKFFDSDECRAKQLEISRYENIITEYEEAVRKLFPEKYASHSTSVYIEQLVSLKYDYQKYKDALNQQLADLHNRLNHLSTSYLEVVQQVEERVKQ